MKKILLIIVVILAASPVYALTGLSFGVKGGVAMNADLGKAEGYSNIEDLTLVGAQLKIATLPIIDFIGTVEYAWGKEDLTGNVGEFKFHDLALTASVVYPFNVQIVKPYAGIGIGTHALAYSISGTVAGYQVSQTFPDDKSYFGYHLVGGVNIGFTGLPFSITGEARMNWIESDGEKTKYPTLTLGLNFAL